MASRTRRFAWGVAALTALLGIGGTVTATATERRRPIVVAEQPPAVAQDPLAQQVNAYAATVFANGGITFTPCGELHCGTLTVPLDYRNPSRGTTTVAVKRRPADLSYGRRGVLFVNPGGPGASAAASVTAFATIVGRAVREQFDIIGIDPRGVVTEQPHCTTPGAFPYPLDVVKFPTNPHQDAAMRELDDAVAASCRFRPPRLLRHMSTADAARDLDVARQALGEGKVWFYGTSYGTHLGRTYATLYPQSVAALVLDGVVDSAAWTTGRGDDGTRIPQDVRLLSGPAAKQALDAAIAACEAATDAQCPTRGTLRADLTSLQRDLKQLPLLVPIPGKPDTFEILTYDVLMDRVHRALYDGRVLPALFAALREIRTTAMPVEPEPPHEPTLHPEPPTSGPSDPPPPPLPSGAPTSSAPTSTAIPSPPTPTTEPSTSASATAGPTAAPTTSAPEPTAAPPSTESPTSEPPTPTRTTAPPLPEPSVTRVPPLRQRRAPDSVATGAWAKLNRALAATAARPLAPPPAAPPSAQRRSATARSGVGTAEDAIRVTLQAVACSDAVNPSEPTPWYTLAEQSRRVDDFTQIWLWQNSVCGIPGVFESETAYKGGFARPDGPPILILNTTYDPATPLQGAEAVRADHPTSRLITVPWWGHGVLNLSTCASNYRALFLLYGHVPSYDVRCAPDVTLLPAGR